MNKNKTFLNLEDELHNNLNEIAPALEYIKTTEREIAELKKCLATKRKEMNVNLSKSIKAFDKLLKMNVSPERKKLVSKMGWQVQKAVNNIGKHIDSTNYKPLKQ